MQTPLGYCMNFPNRLPLNIPQLELTQIAQLNFIKPDMQKFPCLRLAKEAMRLGNAAKITLNAANEVAVDEFLKGNIKFTDIAKIVDHQLEACNHSVATISLEDILALDKEVRVKTEENIKL